MTLESFESSLRGSKHHLSCFEIRDNWEGKPGTGADLARNSQAGVPHLCHSQCFYSWSQELTWNCVPKLTSPSFCSRGPAGSWVASTSLCVWTLYPMCSVQRAGMGWLTLPPWVSVSLCEAGSLCSYDLWAAILSVCFTHETKGVVRSQALATTAFPS